MNTKRYRFYVGLTDKNKQLVKPELYFRAMDYSLGATGYTAYEADGVWKGEHEKSLVFEVLSEELTRKQVRETVDFLQMAGNQETVMVTIDHCVEQLFFS